MLMGLLQDTRFLELLRFRIVGALVIESVYLLRAKYGCC